MLKPVVYDSLGRGQYGWLDARYHFSFANYNNPERNGFGQLLVINDDLIQDNAGFPEHSHRNMEIITYVRKGAISHKDSAGNQGITTAGNIQVMSAGTGIKHSEWNSSDKVTSLYQIWIKPRKNNVTPRWDAVEFPKANVKDTLALLVAGDESAHLQINQDAQIYAGVLQSDVKIQHKIHKLGYLLISAGKVLIKDGQQTIELTQGDGCEITQQPMLQIEALADAEILLIDVPE